jgi:hypothetical protein
MTCDHAAELLPWLLNGTLEPGERRELLAHVRTCEACRRALDETRFALAAADAHLPSEVLVAVAFGEPVPASGAAPPLDPALIEEHLEACPLCAAELELARTSRALADESVALLPRRVPAGGAGRERGWRTAAVAAGLAALVSTGGWLATWRALELGAARVATHEEPRPGAGQTPEDQRLAVLAEKNRLLRDAATALEARERAARLEAEALRQKIAQAGTAPAGGAAAEAGPQVNTVIADLYPPGQDVVRGGPREGTVVKLPAGAGGVTLILNSGSDKPSPYREHAVELRDASGRRVWSARGLVQQELTYTLNIPRAAAHPGAYTLELYGLAGQRREKLESYSFRIE